MKLISNYFDMGLFREGLRQNKVIGIIGLAISIGFSVLTPVGAALMVAYFSFMNHFDVMLYGDVDEIPDYASRLNDFLDDIHLSCEGMFDTSYMTIVFLILVSIATFRLFNFLTKRNASDYFHSFPHKRSCIFTSYILSIVFMSFVQSLAFFVTTSVTYGILYYFFGFTLYKSFIYAIEIFIVCILVTVTVATACAMTGNLFSSIVVSAVLLAVPRLFITILSAEITLGTDHLVFNRLSEFSNINTNLLTALTLRSSGGMMISLDQFLDIPGLYAIIYTLGLAFVTYIIGLIFFKKKHSEAAGKPSNTPFLQLIFRIIPAMPLTIIPIAMLIYPGVDIVDFFVNLADNPFTLFVIVAIELACMSIMMLYEIISTKSFNKSYKGILTMPLFLLIQVIIVVYFSIVSYREIHFAPDTDKINLLFLLSLMMTVGPVTFHLTTAFTAYIITKSLTKKLSE